MVYFFLAFYRIEHQSLWLDEIITVITYDPSRPLLDSGRWFGGRGPLYPLFIQLWPKWGSTEFAFRSLSVVFGGITVCLAYLTALRLYNRRAAWISAILFATSPFLIWYSQEARYINLAIMASVATMYMFHLALSTKHVCWWLLYCGSVIFAFGAFMVNLLLVAAQALYVVTTAPSGRANFRRSLVTYLVFAALFVWWANDGRIQALGGYWLRLYAQMMPTTVKSPPSPSLLPLAAGGSRESNPMELPYTPFAFSTGFSLGPSVREIQVSRSLATLLPHAFTLTTSALLFGGLFVVGIAVLWRNPDVGRLLVFWFAIPLFATLVIAAVVPGWGYNVRYACAAFPAYLFIVAAGIASFQPLMRSALLSAVLFTHGVSLANYYHNPHYAREDARAAARFLESTARASDVIVAVGAGLPVQYYYKGPLPIRTFNARSPNTDMAQYVRSVKEDHDRIWLVEIRPWQTDPAGQLKTALDRMTVPEQKQFPGVNIYGYRIADS